MRKSTRKNRPRNPTPKKDSESEKIVDAVFPKISPTNEFEGMIFLSFLWGCLLVLVSIESQNLLFLLGWSHRGSTYLGSRGLLERCQARRGHPRWMGRERLIISDLMGPCCFFFPLFFFLIGVVIPFKIPGWWFQRFFIILTNIFQMGWNHQLDTQVSIESWKSWLLDLTVQMSICMINDKNWIWDNSPENQHAPWKQTPGKGDSYWKPPFSGAMLVSGSATPSKQTLVSWDKINPSRMRAMSRTYQ